MASGKLSTHGRHRKYKPKSVKKNVKSVRSSMAAVVVMDMSDNQYKNLPHKKNP